MCYDINFRLQLKPSSQLSALLCDKSHRISSLNHGWKKNVGYKNNQWEVRWSDRGKKTQGNMMRCGILSAQWKLINIRQHVWWLFNTLLLYRMYTTHKSSFFQFEYSLFFSLLFITCRCRTKLMLVYWYQHIFFLFLDFYQFF